MKKISFGVKQQLLTQSVTIASENIVKL